MNQKKQTHKNQDTESTTRNYMRRWYGGIALLLGFVFLLGLVLIFSNSPTSRTDHVRLPYNLANAYFALTTTTDGLRAEFQDIVIGKKTEPLHIIVMPGHEPGYGGAVYEDLRETEMNVTLAHYLEQFLEADDNFRVTTLRDNEGWLPELEEYFNTHREEIEEYVAEQKELTRDLVTAGELSFNDTQDMYHGDAPGDIAYRLYAINYWLSNEVDADMVIHIHFNDTASRNVRTQDPSGFAIYVPHTNYTNYEPSIEAAEYIFNRLDPWYASSNHRQEIDGVVPNHKLIALGTKNTLSVASLLIEYGYIYERRFSDPDVFNEIAFDMALQTYWGIQDFFAGAPVDTRDNMRSGLYARIPTGALPLRSGDPRSPEIVVLQALLRSAEVYPPEGKDMRQCGLDGSYGPCTENAVRAFQSQYDIDVDGVAGQETLDRLYERPREEYRELLSE